MGSSADSSGSYEKDVAKIQRKKEEEARKKAFETYNKQKQASDKSVAAGSMPLPISRPSKQVARNMNLASDLEKRASTQDWTGQDRSKHNIGVKGTSMQMNLREAMFPFGRVMTEIQSQAYKSQAEHLRKGGKPVYDKYENYQGVVHKNWLGHTSYSGRIGWNPLGRSDVNYNTESGSYTSSFKDDLQGGSESSNVNTSNVDANNVTDSQTASVKPTVRKSLLASNMSGGGDAKRRGLINARKLT